jgi:AsmA protein
VLVLLALPLGTLATVVLIASPGKVLRDKLIRQVRNRLGRDIEIRGGISFIASPQPGILLSRIVVPPPEGMTGPATLTARGLRLDMAIAPLLQGRIVVEHAQLIAPAIDLGIDRDGRRSWQIVDRKKARLQLRKPTRTTNGAAVTMAGPGLGTASIKHLGRSEFALKTLVVRNGTVHYHDARSGNRQTLTALNLDLAAPGFDSQMRATGTVTWRGKQLTLNSRVETLARLLARRSTKTHITIAGAEATAGFDGTIQLAERVGAVGQIGLSVASLDSYLDLYGIKSPSGLPFGRLEASGYLSYGGDNVQLSGARLAIGTTRATGAITVRLGRARPSIAADLKIAQLDADRLMGLLRIAPKLSIATLRPDPDAVTPDAVDDLLRRDRATGGVGRFSLHTPTASPAAAWRTKPLDAGALRRADVGVRLAIEGFKLGGLQFTRTGLRIQLNNGNLSAHIDDGELYGGRVHAALTARPSENGVTITLNCFAEGVAAGDLLTDTAGVGILTGTTRIAAKLSGIGASEQQIMSTLAGTARVVLTDGAVAGWDVGAILDELKSGQIPKLSNTPSEKTKFRELSATFAVNNGVAHTGDLRMVTGVFFTQGSGLADIGRRRIDLLTNTKFTASGREKSGQPALKDLVLPIRVRGDWRKPSVTLEIENAFRNPDQARETLRKARRRFKGRDPKKIVSGILRDGKKSEDVRAAKKLLKDLFR